MRALSEYRFIDFRAEYIKENNYNVCQGCTGDLNWEGGQGLVFSPPAPCPKQNRQQTCSISIDFRCKLRSSELPKPTNNKMADPHDYKDDLAINGRRQPSPGRKYQLVILGYQTSWVAVWYDFRELTPFNSTPIFVQLWSKNLNNFTAI